MSQKIKSFFSIPVMVVMAMLLSVYPYIITYFVGLPDVTILIPLFLIITLLLCVIKYKKGRMLPLIIVGCMVVQCFFWILFSIAHDDSSYFTRVVFIVTTFFSLWLLKETNSHLKFVNLYGGWITLQAFLAAIAFVLVLVGIIQPLKIVYLNDDHLLYFYGITCTNSVLGNFIRPAGFFDEPGALASWGIFSMLLNKLTSDNRKIEIICALSLLFTWSAAFFVLFALYIIFFYLRHFRKYFPIIIIVGLGIFVIFNSMSNNEEFLHMTTERFANGHIRSKRDIAKEVAKKEFEKSIWIGVGGHQIEKTTETASDNSYEILAKDGIIGYVITYLPILVILIKYRKEDVWASSLILMASYMQRPFHINEMHYFMIYMYMLVVYCKYNKKSLLSE